MPAQGDLPSSRRCLGSENESLRAGADPNEGYAALKLAHARPFSQLKRPRARPPSSAIATDLSRTRGSPRVASWAGQLAAVFRGSRGLFSKNLGEEIDRPTHMTIRYQCNYSWKCVAEEVYAVTFETIASVPPTAAPPPLLVGLRL